MGLPADEANDKLGKFISEFAYRIQWRTYFRDEIFPRLVNFAPDFIFISAGFDAHKKDTINQGYIALVEDDFEWVTANLLKISNTFCEGRIVSVLEGGYQLGGEYYSAFAQSTKAHVRSLSQGLNCRPLFSVAECQAETKLEDAHLKELKHQREQHLILRKEQSLKLKLAKALLLQQVDQPVNANELVEPEVDTKLAAEVDTKLADSNTVPQPPEADSKPESDGKDRKRRRTQVKETAVSRQ